MEAYNEAFRPWSANEMYEYAKRMAGPKYVLDDYSEPVFRLLSQYFTNDPEFEKAGFKLEKGIMLTGKVGVGKTEILKAFRFNKRCCFAVESCNEVEEYCKNKDLDFWKTYTGPVPGHGGIEMYFYQQSIGWMLDDLGTEQVIVKYGNRLDPLERIIHYRNLNKDRLPFFTMHLTTNLDGNLIENRYGQRMRSRLREMFNVIELKGSDRRI